jgi:hypothetical protein
MNGRFVRDSRESCMLKVDSTRVIAILFRECDWNIREMAQIPAPIQGAPVLQVPAS